MTFLWPHLQPGGLLAGNAHSHNTYADACVKTGKQENALHAFQYMAKILLLPAFQNEAVAHHVAANAALSAHQRDKVIGHALKSYQLKPDDRAAIVALCVVEEDSPLDMLLKKMWGEALHEHCRAHANMVNERVLNGLAVHNAMQQVMDEVSIRSGMGTIGTYGARAVNGMAARVAAPAPPKISASQLEAMTAYLSKAALHS